MPARKPHLSRAEWSLVGVTVIWGITFLAVHQGLTLSGPLFFVGCRFGCAALCTALSSGNAWRTIRAAEWRAGGAIGSFIFVGYALQAYGQQTIAPSMSAFITALYVPLVPLLQWGVLKQPPRGTSWLGIALAFAGLCLLSGPEAGETFQLERGQLFTLAGAVAVAAEILLIGRVARKLDTQRCTLVQLLSASACAFALMPCLGERVPLASGRLLALLLALGAATAAIQLVMNWAQQSVSPTRATVIYAGEPVWAGVFGWLAGDRLAPLAWAGAALIVCGVLISEWKPAEGPSCAERIPNKPRETPQQGRAEPAR